MYCKMGGCPSTQAYFSYNFYTFVYSLFSKRQEAFLRNVPKELREWVLIYELWVIRIKRILRRKEEKKK